MTAMVLRVLIFLIIGAAIYLGVRKIWRDWQGQFTSERKARRVRDLAERRRPDVIDLKRDGDGIYRPGPGESRHPDGQD